MDKVTVFTSRLTGPEGFGDVPDVADLAVRPVIVVAVDFTVAELEEFPR
jgi:hypothetical protein